VAGQEQQIRKRRKLPESSKSRIARKLEADHAEEGRLSQGDDMTADNSAQAGNCPGLQIDPGLSNQMRLPFATAQMEPCLPLPPMQRWAACPGSDGTGATTAVMFDY